VQVELPARPTGLACRRCASGLGATLAKARPPPCEEAARAWPTTKPWWQCHEAGAAFASPLSLQQKRSMRPPTQDGALLTSSGHAHAAQFHRGCEVGEVAKHEAASQKHGDANGDR